MMISVSNRTANIVGKGENAGYQHRIQKFPEKALVLQDKCLPKGTLPALISTCLFLDQFKLKESQNRDFFPPILVHY